MRGCEISVNGKGTIVNKEIKEEKKDKDSSVKLVEIEQRIGRKQGFSNNIPNWLDSLFKVKFFDPCLDHRFRPKERNIFCLDCCISFCSLCSDNHFNHRVLQIRKYNSHEVVKTEEMEKLMNCALVQPYNLNRAFVVFLKAHPSKKKEAMVEESVQNQMRNGKGQTSESSNRICSSCSCSLREDYKYCSISCKVKQLLKTDGSIDRQIRYRSNSSLPSDRELNDERHLAEQISRDLTAGDSSRSMHNGTESAEFSRGKRKTNSEASRSGSVVVNRRKGVPCRSPHF